MKDPKEKDEALPSNDDTAEQQTNDTEGNSWNEHQQVDEEGVEVDPEDVK